METIQAWTRFIYPFFFRLSSADAAANALIRGPVETHPQTEPIWTSEPCHPLYKHELLDPVSAFLFSKEPSRGIRYIQTHPSSSDGVLNCAEVLLRPGVSVLMERVPKHPLAELFISDQGVGLLSINLSARAAPDSESAISVTGRPTLLETLESNYRLTRTDERSQMRTVKVSGTTVRREPRSPPVAQSEEASILDRATHLGGSFTLMQLAAELLRALKPFDPSPIQEQLSAYTVVRFGQGLDFADPMVRQALAPAIAAFSQIEEATNAGHVAPDEEVVTMNPSRRHWVALSTLGAVHFVSDQPADQTFGGTGVPGASQGLPFNDERPRRAFTKFFSPYLIVFLQSLTLQRLMADAANDHQDPAPGEPTLRARLLLFGVNGHFARVSSRHSLHRYYHACQTALDVPAMIELTRHAIGDFDTEAVSRRQLAIAEEAATTQKAIAQIALDAAKNLTATTTMQQHVAWIECFLVSVYAAHLWEMCSKDGVVGFSNGHWTIAAVALISWAVAVILIIILPGRHR